MTTSRTTARYQALTAQLAYRRRVAAFGLPALLAPYTQKPLVRIPEQRKEAQ